MSSTYNSYNRDFYTSSYGSYYKKTDFTTIFKNEHNKIEVDVELLLTLYSIQSPSGSEDIMYKELISYINRTYGKSVELATDNNNNLYITKGIISDDEFYPCVVAHMDEVHKKDVNRRIVRVEDLIFGMDMKTGERSGIGADDKNGIYVALEMLKYFDKIKILLTTEEEVGCVGSNAASLSFFKNVGSMFQCDRKGNSDLITRTNGVEVMDDKFIESIEDICLEYGYVKESGTSTDIGALKKRGVDVQSCNISCGYWDAHTKSEFTHIPSLENAMNFMMYLIDHCGTKLHYHKTVSEYFPKTYSKTTYSNKSVTNSIKKTKIESEEDINYCNNCRTLDCYRCTKFDSVY